MSDNDKKLYNLDELELQYSVTEDVRKKIEIITDIYDLGYYDNAEEKLIDLNTKKTKGLSDEEGYYQLWLNIYELKKKTFELNKVKDILIKEFAKDERFINLRFTGNGKDQIDKLMRIINDKKFLISWPNYLGKSIVLCLLIYAQNMTLESPIINHNGFRRFVEKYLYDLLEKPNRALKDIICLSKFISVIDLNHHAIIKNWSSLNLERFLISYDRVIFPYIDLFSDKKKSDICRTITGVKKMLATIKDDKKYEDELNKFTQDYFMFLDPFSKYVLGFNQHTNNLKETIQGLNSSDNIYMMKDVYQVLINELFHNHFDGIIGLDIEPRNENIKVVLDLFISLARFYKGESIDFEEIQKQEIIVEKDIILFVEYDNKLIQYEDFLKELAECNEIICTLTMFERYLKVMKEAPNNTWLTIIINKLSIENVQEYDRIILYILTQIKKCEIACEFNDFENIYKSIRGNSFDKLSFITLSELFLISYYTFGVKADEINSLFSLLLEKLDEVEYLHNDSIEAFLYNMACYISENRIGGIDLVRITDLCNRKGLSKGILLVYSFLNKRIKDEDYLDLIHYIDILMNKNINDFTDLEKAITHFCFINTLGGEDFTFCEQDIIYSSDMKFNAFKNDDLNEIYARNGIEITETDDFDKSKPLSLIMKMVTTIVFSNDQAFNLKKITIPDNTDEIFEALNKAIGKDETDELKNKIINNGEFITTLMNVFTLEEYMKTLKTLDKNNRMFDNISNDIVTIKGKKLIHVSTLLLAGYLDCLDIIEKNETCFLSGNLCEEIIEKYSVPTIDLAEGRCGTPIYYDDILQRIAECILRIDDSRKLYVPFLNYNNKIKVHNPDSYDNDTLNILLYEGTKPQGFVCDDMFWHINTTRLVSGIFSLAFEAYYLKLIDSSQFLKMVKGLDQINYKNMYPLQLINVLMEDLQDPNIYEIIDICSKQAQ